MGLFDLIRSARPEYQTRINDELALLKQQKLTQDQIRFTEKEQKQISESDRIVLSKVHPVVRGLAIQTIIQASNMGLLLGVYMGLRTFAEQDALFAKGRDANGIIINKKLVVTNSRGGSSWHNFGCAVDIVMDGNRTHPGIQWSWNEFVDNNKDGVNDWIQLGKIGKKLGFVWGGDWVGLHDVPHFQHSKGLKNVQEALSIYQQGGIQAVWNKVV